MFKRKKKNIPVENTIGFHEDGISYVRVIRESADKPQVSALEFFTCDPENRADTLNALVKKYKLKKSVCSSFLRFDDYRLLSAETPAVPEEDVVDAIGWEIKEKIGFPLEEATIDIFPVPAEALNQNSVNVVAAKKVAITEKTEMFKEANLNLRMIDIEELAYRNIAATQKNEKSGSVVFILRKDHAMVLFCKAGELHFSRRLAAGYDALNSDPAQIESIALEIQRSIDYFDRHFASIGINNLILLPYPGSEKNTVDFLNKNLTLSCALSDLSQGIEWDQEFNHQEISRCLLALGTALRVTGEAA